MLNRSLFVNKRLSVYALVLIIISVICGCNENQTAHIPKSDKVVFTDALGRNVSVEKNPERVAALIGGLADIWMLSGGTLCAAPEDAWIDFELPLDDAVNIGGTHTPNLETLMAANPDFVIAGASTASNVELKEILENAGITVAYFDVNSFNDYLSMLDICTDITGNKALYEKNGTKLKRRIDEVKKRCKDADLSEKERKILLFRASSGSVKTKGSKGTVLGEMLSELGCINIADSDTTLTETLNAESVIVQDPYRIFVAVMGDDSEKAVNNLKNIINENQALKTLTAVKEGRLHIMDRELFHIKPNEKWAESYEKLSRILLETDE